MEGEICPQCDTADAEGVLVEDDMGLTCDSCGYYIPDPKKFRKDDPEEEWEDE